MSTSYLLTIDQSTSATKAMLFNHNAELVDRVSILHKQYYPKAGFVEHDPDEIFHNTIAGIKQLIHQSGTDESTISGIAITNQRETLCVFDRKTSAPAHRGIGERPDTPGARYPELAPRKDGGLPHPYR